MSLTNTPLFHAMKAKMVYLDQRQAVLAQNIANADTPNYRARDLTEIDFGTVLDKTISNGDKMGVRPVSLQTTQPGHMPMADVTRQADERKARITYEVAPADNSVIIEEQMVKANKVQMDYNLVTNLMRKNSNMFRIALGVGAQ